MDNITFMTRVRAHRPATRGKPTRDPPLREKGFDLDVDTEHYASATFCSLPDSLRWKWMNQRELAVFCVFSCGYFQRAEGHRWERSHLNEGIVLYCVEGKGLVSIQGTTYPVIGGDVVYCPPNTHHDYEADPADPWSIYWMHVSGDKLAQLGGFHRSFSEKPVQHIGVIAELIVFFRSLVQHFDSTDHAPHWLLSSLSAQHILAYICNAPKLVQSEITHVKMLHVLIHHMRTISETRVSLDELIRTTGFSKTHVCKLFKAFTGLSPMAYLNKLRIEKACVMLTATDMQVSEISSRLGFYDPYYFSRLFKKATGHAPGKFRKSHLTDSRRTYRP